MIKSTSIFDFKTIGEAVVLEIFSNFPFAKILYTLAMIAVVAFFSREIYSIWFDQRLYVGAFNYFIEGKSDQTQAKAFPALILGQHQLFRSALIAENERRLQEGRPDAPPDAEIAYALPTSLPEIAQWQSVLADIELKVQGFDLGKLLSTLRTSISPPDEITGFVEKSGSVSRASVAWPKRRTRQGAEVRTPFETGELADDASIALAIAASIAWSQAADASAQFAKIPRPVFVAWALAWWDFRRIQERRSPEQPVTDDDKRRWRQARRLLDAVAAQAEKYPEIWRLRADLIEADLGNNKSAADKKLEEEDRLRYAAASQIALGSTATAAARTLSASRASAQATQASSAVQPGLLMWCRRAGATGDFQFAVTIAAVVLDRARQRRILLPRYALSEGGDTEFSLDRTGPVVATAGPDDVIKAENDSTDGVLLARLADHVTSKNTLADAAIPEGIPALRPDEAVTLSTAGRSIPGTIAKMEGRFALTTSRITEPGDAGAPVLNRDGHLVAMGYSATDSSSRLLTLKWAFDQAGLTLEP